jgi:hypothetical protein
MRKVFTSGSLGKGTSLAIAIAAVLTGEADVISATLLETYLLTQIGAVHPTRLYTISDE